jgi:DNA-binding beta-propeller fold protein YncE
VTFGTHGDGSGDFAQPKGIGVDGDGHIYIADAAFNRVQIFDAEGSFLLAIGREGTGAGEFLLPSGVFVAGDRIYVADSYNRRVQVFEFLGGG